MCLQVVEKVDPRIHFALVCGAKSCPPIKLYTPENLEEALDSAGVCVFCPLPHSQGYRYRVLNINRILLCHWASSFYCHVWVTHQLTDIPQTGEAFCSGEVQVDKQRNEVRLSKIFKVQIQIQDPDACIVESD